MKGLLALGLSCLGLLPSSAAEKDAAWPEGLVLKKDTTSPDGRYGILVHRMKDMPDDQVTDPYFEDNRLADLKEHRILTRIGRAWYAEGEDQLNLKAAWTPDSAKCVLFYGRRERDGEAILIQPGDRFQRFLDWEILAEAEKAVPNAITSNFVTTIADGQVRLWGTVNTEGLYRKEREYTGREAVVAGAFDITAGKWLTLKAAEVTGKEMGTVVPYEGLTPDELMNSLYHLLKALMPPEKFTTLQTEQREWLKQRGTEEDGTATVQRCRDLEKILWGL